MNFRSGVFLLIQFNKHFLHYRYKQLDKDEEQLNGSFKRHLTGNKESTFRIYNREIIRELFE